MSSVCHVRTNPPPDSCADMGALPSPRRGARSRLETWVRHFSRNISPALIRGIANIYKVLGRKGLEPWLIQFIISLNEIQPGRPNAFDVFTVVHLRRSAGR